MGATYVRLQTLLGYIWYIFLCYRITQYIFKLGADNNLKFTVAFCWISNILGLRSLAQLPSTMWQHLSQNGGKLGITWHALWVLYFIFELHISERNVESSVATLRPYKLSILQALSLWSPWTDWSSG